MAYDPNSEYRPPPRAYYSQRVPQQHYEEPLYERPPLKPALSAEPVYALPAYGQPGYEQTSGHYDQRPPHERIDGGYGYREGVPYSGHAGNEPASQQYNQFYQGGQDQYRAPQPAPQPPHAQQHLNGSGYEYQREPPPDRNWGNGQAPIAAQPEHRPTFREDPTRGRANDFRSARAARNAPQDVAPHVNHERVSPPKAQQRQERVQVRDKSAPPARRKPLIDDLSPITVPQDNAFPTFPTKKEIEKAKSRDSYEARNSAEVQRPSTSGSVPQRNHGHADGQHYAGNAAPQRPQTSSAPSHEHMSTGGAEQAHHISERTITQPAKVPMYDQYPPPSQQTSHVPRQEQVRGQQSLAPANKIPIQPSLASQLTGVESVRSVERKPVLRHIATDPIVAQIQQPAYVGPQHSGPAGPSQRSAAGRPVVQQAQPLYEPSSAIVENAQKPWDDDRDSHENLGDFYDDYYHDDPGFRGKTKSMVRDAQIEAEMPDFGDSGEQPKTKTAHQRGLTIDAHLNDFNPPTHPPVPAYVKPVYNGGQHAVTSPEVRAKTVPAEMTGFVFGVPGEQPPQERQLVHHMSPDFNPRLGHARQGSASEQAALYADEIAQHQAAQFSPPVGRSGPEESGYGASSEQRFHGAGFNGGRIAQQEAQPGQYRNPMSSDSQSPGWYGAAPAEHSFAPESYQQEPSMSPVGHPRARHGARAEQALYAAEEAQYHPQTRQDNTHMPPPDQPGPGDSRYRAIPEQALYAGEEAQRYPQAYQYNPQIPQGTQPGPSGPIHAGPHAQPFDVGVNGQQYPQARHHRLPNPPSSHPHQMAEGYGLPPERAFGPPVRQNTSPILPGDQRRPEIPRYGSAPPKLHPVDTSFGALGRVAMSPGPSRSPQLVTNPSAFSSRQEPPSGRDPRDVRDPRNMRDPRAAPGSGPSQSQQTVTGQPNFAPRQTPPGGRDLRGVREPKDMRDPRGAIVPNPSQSPQLGAGQPNFASRQVPPGSIDRRDMRDPRGARDPRDMRGQIDTRQMPPPVVPASAMARPPASQYPSYSSNASSRRDMQPQQMQDPRQQHQQQQQQQQQTPRLQAIRSKPDALPHHPAPIRPGLMDPSPSQASRPPPVRQYDQTPNTSMTSASKPPSTVSRTSVDEIHQNHPVTSAELDQLRGKVDANPKDFKIALFLAKRLVEASSVLAPENGRLDAKATDKNRERYVLEAHKRVKRLVQAGYPQAMFYLADCYGQGLLGLQVDTKEAFSLYQQAAKAGHPAAAYRTAVCCEIGPDEGGGTRKDPTKAVQWYRRAAQLGDAAAMYKLGAILLKGLLGQSKNIAEAVVWLKKAADNADADNPHALHELALLHDAANLDPAVRDKVVADDKYARELFMKAAKLGYKFSQYRLGQAYEYGSLGLPIDARNSIAWYSKAAAQGEHNAELSLSGWYLTGAEGLLEHSDTEAYLWARKAACSEPPMAKAMFAMGYYSENGIGCPANMEEAKRWYGRAASFRFPKALERLEELRKGKAASRSKPVEGRLRRDQKKAEECVVM